MEAATTSTSSCPPGATVPSARTAPGRCIGPGAEHGLRVGVVGLGRQAREDHVPAVLASEMTELVAVCDTDPDRLAAARLDLGVAGYHSIGDMLGSADLDLVIVAVPHHAGRAVIAAAADHGVHVLKEKPFATSLDEARELAARCARSGIELMVTMQRRFNPIYSTFHQLYDRIGRPFLVDAVYTPDVDPAEGWRGQHHLAGGGCIIDMGYHTIDLLIWYFGLPDRVLAQYTATACPELDYDAEDTAQILFGYDSGPIGSVLLSRCIPPRSEHLRVVGSQGMVTLERGRIRRFGRGGEIVESLSRELSWPTAATAQIDHFCRILRGSRTNFSGPGNHLAHAAFIEACYASRQRGQFVDPKELIA